MLDYISEIEKEVPQDDSASEEEKLLLYALIRNLKPEVVVETGTHRGKSTLYMAQALHDNHKGHIYTADPNTEWNAKGNFRKFPELEKRITLYDGRGDEMPIEDKIDFMFIDGLHEREEVLSEMEHFKPFLKKETVIVFHDCKQDNKKVGVNQAVKELKLKNIALATENYIRVASRINPS